MKTSKLILLACLIFVYAGKVEAQNDLEVFVKKFQKTILKGAYYKETQKDLTNGYMAICVPAQGEKECSLSADIYTIAMWKTTKGGKIFGAFKHACGGMGCWSENMQALVFYDENLQNITIKMCDLAKIQKLAETTELKNEQIDSVDAEQRNVYVEIPQKGTTIQITVGLVGVVSKNFAELKFDKSAGIFKLIAK